MKRKEKRKRKCNTVHLQVSMPYPAKVTNSSPALSPFYHLLLETIYSVLSEGKRTTGEGRLLPTVFHGPAQKWSSLGLKWVIIRRVGVLTPCTISRCCKPAPPAPGAQHQQTLGKPWVSQPPRGQAAWLRVITSSSMPSPRRLVSIQPPFCSFGD